MIRPRRTYMTRDAIAKYLKKTIERSGLTAAQWATAHGLSPGLVSAVTTKRTTPGPKILKALGIETTHYFVRIHGDETTDTDDHDDKNETEETLSEREWSKCVHALTLIAP